MAGPFQTRERAERSFSRTNHIETEIATLVRSIGRFSCLIFLVCSCCRQPSGIGSSRRAESFKKLPHSLVAHDQTKGPLNGL